jgi:hypothetical protein
MKHSLRCFESIQEALDKGAPNPRYEAQGQPIKDFFGHRDSQERNTLSAEGGSDGKKRFRRWRVSPKPKEKIPIKWNLVMITTLFNWF